MQARRTRIHKFYYVTAGAFKRVTSEIVITEGEQTSKNVKAHVMRLLIRIFT